MRRWLLGGGLFLAPPAYADLYQVASLDWIVFASDAVVRGEVVAAGDGTATIAVQEVISGDPGSVRLEGRVGPQRVGPGATGLFAIQRAGATVHLVWIGHPVQGPAVVLDKHQQQLAGEAAVLAYARERAAWDRAHPRPADLPPITLDPQFTFAEPVALDSPSGFLVPPDPEFWPIVVSWATSPSWNDRVRGARALRSYPGPEAVRLLATLVRDPHLVPVTDAAGVVTERVFPVRVQAWETATALQADLPEPLLRE